MSVQTSVDLRIAKARAGLIADVHHSNKIISIAAEAAIPFGVVTQRGTDKETQAIIGGTATSVLGIATREMSRTPATIGGTVTGYLAGDTAGIMQEGYVYAVCVDGCTAGDPVKFVNATGALSTGAAAAGETLVGGATWQETVAAGEIAKLHWNPTSLTAGS